MKSGVFVFAIAAVMSASAGVFTPAATVRFADLRKIASSVSALGKSSGSMMMTTSIPAAIRNQRAARLFGAMRQGYDGVAVCFVDADAIARLSSPKMRGKADSDAYDRAKRWSLLYPGTLSKAGFLKKRPDAKEKQGVVVIPGAGRGTGPLYAIWSADGFWVAMSSSPSLAKATFGAAQGALKVPLGQNLARIRMDAHGAKAIFGDTSCSGGEINIALTLNGLELDGTVQRVGASGAVLPPGALAFAGVPADASLFGAASSPDDLRSADVFSLLGPSAGAIVKQSVSYLRSSGGVQTYYIGAASSAKRGVKAQKPASAIPPRTRLERIMPEVRKHADLDGVMFCSPVAVFRACLPKISASLPPGEEMKLRLAANLLGRTNGSGLGFMSWRESSRDRYFCRVSVDELRATAALWGTLFAD